MQVFLKFPEKLQKSTEESSFIILEFQGKIESFQEELDFLELGEITHSSDNIYNIKIGNHILEGVKSKLGFPMIITENGETTDENERDLLVIGVCREKILFNKRPTPIFDQFKRIKDNSADNIFINAKKK